MNEMFKSVYRISMRVLLICLSAYNHKERILVWEMSPRERRDEHHGKECVGRYYTLYLHLFVLSDAYFI